MRQQRPFLWTGRQRPGFADDELEPAELDELVAELDELDEELDELDEVLELADSLELEDDDDPSEEDPAPLLLASFDSLGLAAASAPDLELRASFR